MIEKKKFEVEDMDLKEIRDSIVSNLHKYTNAPVVLLEDIGDRPAYPFITYKFIVLYNIDGQGGISETRLASSLDERFDNDYEEIVYYQPQMTLSLTSYSDNELEGQELAMKAHDYFKHAGYHDLQRINTSVVSTKAFGDRTIKIVDNYDYRTGFDVILRTSDKIKRRIETIEEYRLEETK